MKRLFNGPTGGGRAPGFTFLEFLVVLVVALLLLVMAGRGWLKHRNSLRQGEVVDRLMTIKAAQERFFAEHGGIYSGSIGDLQGLPPGRVISVSRYTYWIEPVADEDGLVIGGNILARGDLNADGRACDGWRVSLDDLAARPEHFDLGCEETFNWVVLKGLVGFE